jgi:peptide/nickel transport system substrate-binding protein
MQASFKPQALAGLLGVALILGLLVMSTQAGTQSKPAQTYSGDTYVEAMVGAPRWVNPLLALSDTDRDLAHLVFSGLSRVDRQGNLVGDLASGWEAAPDSTVFTFTLKPDLTWHDGEPLTAGDVLFTIGLLQAEDFPGDPALALPWRSVTMTSPVGSDIVFKLTSPNASFPQYTTLGILPRHIWESVKPADLAGSEWNLSPVGSGPWRYARLQNLAGGTGATDTISPAVSSQVAESVQAYDGVLLVRRIGVTAERHSIERIWFRLYPAFGAALTGLKMGEVHGLGHIPVEDLEAVASVPGVSLHTQNLARYNMLIMNLDSPLFDKVETRRALQLAIDRGTVSGDEQERLARPLYGPLLPHSWGYDLACSPPQPQNVAEARRLLDVAGWAVGPSGVRTRNGMPMTVVVAANSDVPTNVTMTQQVVDDLRWVGVDARMVAVSRDVLLRSYLGPRAFHMVLAGWEAKGADPDLYDYWHSSQAATGGLNFAGWSSPAADNALETARANPQREARKPALCDFQRAFAAEVPAIVLSTPLYTYATRSPAGGVALPLADMLSPANRFDTLDSWSLQTP